ncbi:hypothetical protein OAO87_03440 [bacterium]|nr:hypothetical protein [bacterium]
MRARCDALTVSKELRQPEPDERAQFVYNRCGGAARHGGGELGDLAAALAERRAGALAEASCPHGAMVAASPAVPAASALEAAGAAASRGVVGAAPVRKAAISLVLSLSIETGLGARARFPRLDVMMVAALGGAHVSCRRRGYLFHLFFAYFSRVHTE